MDTRPSYGRVHGVGDGTTWKKYYRETTEERKERRRLTEENINKKVEIAVEKKSSETVATAVAAAKQVIADMSGVLVPPVFSWPTCRSDCRYMTMCLFSPYFLYDKTLSYAQ